MQLVSNFGCPSILLMMFPASFSPFDTVRDWVDRGLRLNENRHRIVEDIESWGVVSVFSVRCTNSIGDVNVLLVMPALPANL